MVNPLQTSIPVIFDSCVPAFHDPHGGQARVRWGELQGTRVGVLRRPALETAVTLGVVQDLGGTDGRTRLG